MPLDPSIPLKAQAPAFNPLQMALQAAQYRAYNANAMGAQQQLDANMATSEAYRQSVDPTTGQLDTNKLSAMIAANPASAYNYAQTMKAVQDQRQAQQTYDKGAIDLNNAQRGNYADSMKFLTQQFATVNPEDPNAASKIMQIGSDAVQQGHISPAMFKATVAQFPDDPKQWGAYTKQKLASFQDAAGQLSTMTPETGSVGTGGGTQFYNKDKLTGQVTPTQYIGNTVSPDVAASQVEVTKPDGTKVTVPNATRLQSQGLGGVLPPNGQPQAGAGNGRYPASPEFQTAPAAGVVEANQKANAAGGDMLTADRQSNAQSGTRVQQLQAAQAALKDATTGEGAEKLQKYKSLLVTAGWATADQLKSVTAFDEANKYLTQYAQQKAASFGNGTDAQLSAAIAGNGNTHISNLAAQDVVKVNIGLERMDQARMQAWEQSGLPPSNYAQWKSTWGSSVDPRVFVADQMEPSAIKKMYNGMSAADKSKFNATWAFAEKNGMIGGK